MITNPILVTQTRYQTNPLQSVGRIIRNVYTLDGVKGFYRGLIPSLSTRPMFWGVYFMINGRLKEWFDVETFTGGMMVSYLSGAMTSSVLAPIFVLQTRRQTDVMKGMNYRSMVRRIYEKEGMRAFWKGVSPTMISSLGLGLQIPLQEKLVETTGNTLLSSFTSKMVTASIFYPFSLLRENIKNTTVKVSLMDMVKEVYVNRGGLFGFYRGFMIYNTVSGLNFIIMMQLKSMIKEP